jgi:hypothetical protein
MGKRQGNFSAVTRVHMEYGEATEKSMVSSGVMRRGEALGEDRKHCVEPLPCHLRCPICTIVTVCARKDAETFTQTINSL